MRQVTMHVIRKVAIVSLALLLGSARAGQLPAPVAALVETADAFGPFRFGMAVEDAVAIAPGFDWYEDREPGYRQRRVVTAESGWHLGERTYDVILAPGYHGAYELQLRHTHESDVAESCSDAALALAVEFERRFGELTGPSLDSGQAGELIDVGKGSSVTMRPFVGNLPGATGWFTRRGPTRTQPWRVAVSGDFSRDENGSPPTCKVLGTLAREGEVPREAWLDVAQAPIAHAPSAAVLHHSLDAWLQPHARSRVRELAELSAAGVEVILDCAVRRDTGAVWDCRTTDDDRGGRRVASPLESVVRQRLQHLRFEARAIDSRDPAPLRAKVPMRVAPADRLAPGPVPPTLRPLREIAWAVRPSGMDLERAYPREALRNEIEAVVSASCRLQADLSAVCVDAVVTPAGDAEHTHMFALAAYGVLTKFRARDVLRDGVTAAAGEWFKGSVTFRLGN